MDEGTPEAFLYLLGVINENNFIRFSSVKRAVGTWLGFAEEETVKLERVSDKSIALITDCLTDPAKREEYLNSEDSMKIHIGLWSLGFYESRDLVEKIREISKHGSRHQLLTASYSVNLLNDAVFENSIAKTVVEKYYSDSEVIAAYLSFFMPNVSYWVAKASGPSYYVSSAYEERLQEHIKDYSVREYCSLDTYFQNAEEAEKYYGILKNICDSFKGRKQTYSPFIFPWYSAEFTKGDMIIRLAYIASALHSEKKNGRNVRFADRSQFR